MSSTLDALEAEVLKLPAAERSHLLDRLLASLEVDAEIQEAWALEAERRDTEVEEGKVKLVPGEEAIARLRAELR
ncbi:MAG: addiction module protein [Betaproteobacteria bacterium]|nr:addiction module protein [Betaproteobacteria bacterium]